MTRLTILASALACLVTPLIGVGCAVTTATLDPNDRSVTRSLQDITAARAIKARLLRVEGFTLNDVSVDVAEGIAVLAGTAPSPEDKVEAERIARSAPRISQVGNEIMIGKAAGLWSKTKDEAITTAVRTKLAASSSVRNLNYDVETREGIVYLLGAARDQSELAEAARLASVTRGVREVISYATIKNEIPNAFNAAPQSSTIAQNDPSFWGTPVENVSGNSDILNSPALGDPSSDIIPYSPSSLPSTQPYDLSGSVLDQDAPLSYRPGITQIDPSTLDPDAIDSGEPVYRDPVTKQIIQIPDGVEPLPYMPDTGPGSLGAGGAPLPPGAQASRTLGIESQEDFLGGSSVTVTKPYTMEQGEKIPVRWDGNQWVGVIK